MNNIKILYNQQIYESTYNKFIKDKITLKMSFFSLNNMKYLIVMFRFVSILDK